MQSIIYVPLLVCVFHKSILLIVQYKYFKCCSKDFTLQDLIFRTRLCGTGFIPQHCWVLNIVESLIAAWPKWSGGNVLYPQTGLYQHRMGKSTGLALEYFTYSQGRAALHVIFRKRAQQVALLRKETCNSGLRHPKHSCHPILQESSGGVCFFVASSYPVSKTHWGPGKTKSWRKAMVRCL